MIKAIINKNELPLNIIIGLAIIRTPLLNMCEAMGNGNIIGFGLVALFFVVYIVFMILTIIKIFKIKLNLNKLLSIIIVISVISVWSLFTEVAVYVKESFLSLLLFMILPFICAVLITDRKLFSKYLANSIFINYIIGLVTGYLFVLSGRYYGADAMMATYAIAIPTSYYCYLLFRSNKYKWLNTLFTLIGIAMMFFTGSRGGFIVLLFAGLFGLMSFRSLSDFKFFFQLIFIMVILGLIFFNQVSDIFQGTRIFDLLENGHISGSSGREWYYNAVWNATAERPLFGWGLYGDRICTNGVWAHNLFLEIWCDYGIVVGSLFLIWFIYETIKFIVIKMNKTITILFLIAIPQLLVSNSYLLSCYFWIYIGILVSYSQSTNRKRSINLRNNYITFLDTRS